MDIPDLIPTMLFPSERQNDDGACERNYDGEYSYMMIKVSVLILKEMIMIVKMMTVIMITAMMMTLMMTIVTMIMILVMIPDLHDCFQPSQTSFCS